MDENKLSSSNYKILSSQPFSFHKPKKIKVVATRKQLKTHQKKPKNNSGVIYKEKNEEMLNKKLKSYKENIKWFSRIQLAFKQRE